MGAFVLTMRPFLLACVSVLVAVALSGCLGSAVGPGIPQSALDDEGWTREGDPTLRTFYGLAQMRSQPFAPAGASGVAGVVVVSTTDVPIMKEERFLPEAIATIEAEQGVRFVPTGTETATLVNAGNVAVEAQLYDVEGADTPAKAILITHHCDEPGVFVAVAGYGALPVSTGPLGGKTPDFFASAKALAKAVACRVT
ncbi:MAG TPA: hypothetical protein VI997_08275 [Candidatus Thermoplasmatota archaeon]|nr:hypothetical protein [Candidatus Thermoplasmatota archaeon]